MLIKDSYFFWETYLRHSTFLREVYLFHHSNCNQRPTDPWISVSVFVPVRIAFIYSLNGTVFILTGELAVIHCLINSFSSRYFNYSLEYSPASILSTVLCIFLMVKFEAIQFGQRTFFQGISEHQPLCNTSNLLSMQLYFQSSIYFNDMRDFRREIFFRITSCLDQLRLFYKYFMVTILFLISYFLKINNFSAQVLFQRSFFSRVSNYLEYQSMQYLEAVLILNSYFFRGGTFLGASISWKKSLFLIVLRNQFHSIYTWKDFPLTSIHSFKHSTVGSDFEILPMLYSWK